MAFNQELWDKKYHQQKKLISKMLETKAKSRVIAIQKIGKELALAYAKCRCENEECKAKDNLQYHHLVERSVKNYTDFWKYMAQRHFWANTIVLCFICHIKYHKFVRKYSMKVPYGGKGIIPQKTIDKVKKKYGIENES